MRIGSRRPYASVSVPTPAFAHDGRPYDERDVIPVAGYLLIGVAFASGLCGSAQVEDQRMLISKPSAGRWARGSGESLSCESPEPRDLVLWSLGSQGDVVRRTTAMTWLQPAACRAWELSEVGHGGRRTLDENTNLRFILLNTATKWQPLPMRPVRLAKNIDGRRERHRCLTSSAFLLFCLSRPRVGVDSCLCSTSRQAAQALALLSPTTRQQRRASLIVEPERIYRRQNLRHSYLGLLLNLFHFISFF